MCLARPDRRDPRCCSTRSRGAIGRLRLSLCAVACAVAQGATRRQLAKGGREEQRAARSQGLRGNPAARPLSGLFFIFPQRLQLAGEGQCVALIMPLNYGLN